jgi:hypothetical protein
MGLQMYWLFGGWARAVAQAKARAMRVTIVGSKPCDKLNGSKTFGNS